MRELHGPSKSTSNDAREPATGGDQGQDFPQRSRFIAVGTMAPPNGTEAREHTWTTPSASDVAYGSDARRSRTGLDGPRIQTLGGGTRDDGEHELHDPAVD